jgi:hypothetical protein
VCMVGPWVAALLAAGGTSSTTCRVDRAAVGEVWEAVGGAVTYLFCVLFIRVEDRNERLAHMVEGLLHR